jgi:hypothetical protein
MTDADAWRARMAADEERAEAAIVAMNQRHAAIPVGSEAPREIERMECSECGVDWVHGDCDHVDDPTVTRVYVEVGQGTGNERVIPQRCNCDRDGEEGQRHQRGCPIFEATGERVIPSRSDAALIAKLREEATIDAVKVAVREAMVRNRVTFSSRFPIYRHQVEAFYRRVVDDITDAALSALLDEHEKGTER